MTKFLTFYYNLKHINNNGEEEITPKYVAIHLHEENGLWVTRFPAETLNDLVALAQSQGLNVLIEG